MVFAGGGPFFVSYEITLELALKKWKGKRLSARSVQRIMKGRGVQWRRLREKPLLTKDDEFREEKRPLLGALRGN